MNVAVGVYTKKDGSICLIDTREKTVLTPPFAKASLNPKSVIPKDMPICTKEDTKKFKKSSQLTYLKGHKKAQKVGLAKLFGSMGIGCAIGAPLLIFFGLEVTNNKLRGRDFMESTGFCQQCTTPFSDNLLTPKGVAIGATVIGTKAGIGKGLSVYRNNLAEATLRTDKELAPVTKDIDAKYLEQIKKVEGRTISKAELNNMKYLDKFKALHPTVQEKLLNHHITSTARFAHPHGLGSISIADLYGLNKKNAPNKALDKIRRKKTEVMQGKTTEKKLLTKFRRFVGGMAGAIACERGLYYLFSSDTHL